PGMTFRQSTPLGTAFITVNHTDEGPHEPFEVFVRLGKAGSDLEADAEALGRLISLVLRLSSPISRVARVQLTFRTPLEAIDRFSQEHFEHAQPYPAVLCCCMRGAARNACVPGGGYGSRAGGEG